MSDRCTERQLQVMDVLWDEDGATVRRVKEVLDRRDETYAYTSYLTLLQTLEKKGVVEAEQNPADGRQYIYTPNRSREEEARLWAEAIHDAGMTDAVLKSLEPMVEFRVEVEGWGGGPGESYT